MKKLIVYFVLFVIMSYQVTTVAHAQVNQQLVQWFAGADIVGTSGNKDAGLESDFYVREFELSAFSKIDQSYDGVLTLSYHHELESDDRHMEIHEAFLFSGKIFNLTTLKIGKFFMGFGRLNRFHRHDWVFTEAPLVQKSFFGNEGAKDTGFELKRNLISLNSTLTVGVTSGNEFNHTGIHHHDEQDSSVIEKAKAPTGYLRLARFWEYSTTNGLEVGLNYIHRLDAEGAKYQYHGLDLIYKNRVGKVVTSLLQLEAWSRTMTHKEEHEAGQGAEEESHIDRGAYVYYQKGVDQHHAWGIRYDFYLQDAREDSETSEEHEHMIDGVEVEDQFQALTLAYIYTNSEFMKMRVSLEQGHGIHVEDNEDTKYYTKAMLQFVFSIGAHPAHVY